MRNLLIFMLLVAVFVLGKRSCHGVHLNLGGGISGKGPVQTEQRTAQDFHAIKLELSADVEITMGETYTTEASAQPNILPLLKTSVENGTLRIYTDENFNTSENIKIRISAPTLDRLSLDGSGTIQVMNQLRAEKMSMDISGSGDIICPQTEFGALDINISGSGDIKLDGKAREMNCTIPGSGKVDARRLTVETLNTDISGSGEVIADVVSRLKAEISGSGDVRYSGNPSTETHVSGSGSVQRIEAQ